MVKRILTYAILVFFALFQTSAGQYIRLFGVLPNIALVFTAVYALTNTSFSVSIVGLVCGLLLDSLSKGVFGMNALLIMYISMISSSISRRYYYESKWYIIMNVFIYTVIYESIVLILTSFIDVNIGFFYGLWRYVLLEATLNSAISFPVIYLVNWLNSEFVRGI